MPSPTTCGQNAVPPCCDFQQVVHYVKDGDTIYLKQLPPDEDTYCNQTKTIQAEITKSLVLKAASSAGAGKQTMDQGVYGLHIVLNGSCSEPCSVKIHHSHFFCSWVSVNNLNISVEDSTFENSFITIRSDTKSAGAGHKARIINTEFKHGRAWNESRVRDLVNMLGREGLNYICVSGSWESVEILHSRLQGDGYSQISGLRAENANVQFLSLINVQVIAMVSSLLIDSSSCVGSLNVTRCRFVRNRDGIDIVQGVNHVILSSSEFNETGPRMEEVYGSHEKCSSALKGSPQTLIVQECVFIKNQGVGDHCKGPALDLKAGSKFHKMLPIRSIHTNVNKSEDKIVWPSIEIIQSMFLDNKVLQLGDHKSEEHNSGGAVAILGRFMSVRIRDSLFQENKAFIGAGLYISLQGSHFETDNNLKVQKVTTSRNETVVTHSMENFGSGQDPLDESLEAIQDSSGEDYNNLEVFENARDSSDEKYSLDTITVTVENCSFRNNIAIRSGWGVDD